MRVIDLSGAFRLRDADARGRWYPETQKLPTGVAYGLTEIERDAVAGARLVANPGCYPTAALLALAPLVSAGLLVQGTEVIVAPSRSVGAGDYVGADNLSESRSSPAYGVFTLGRRGDRQGIGLTVTFTPL